jgi:crossover junction endodeoxyribonuclease RuvC
MASPQIILGIDPGTVVMGYGLIAADKSSVALVEMGVLQLHRTADHAERLQLIFNTIQRLIAEHKPTAVAIEAPFFGKNVQSMLKLGRAQGVAMAAAMVSGLMATEYAPRAVKQAVTGRGAASKEQVWSMVQHALGIQEEPKHFDATDAVAVALCHHYQNNPLKASLKKAAGIKRPKRTTSSWEAFAVANPDRLR